MKNRFTYTRIIAVLLALSIVACDDLVDPPTDLKLDRTLSPIGLEATIRNLTTIELKWTVRENVDHYVVEFSEDSLAFNAIIRTRTVDSEELPIQESFFGDTRYSARVKAVSAEGIPDSKWSAITIRTAPENIFILPLLNGDVEANEATLRWPAGSDVTHFAVSPGGAQQTITPEEKVAGEATVTGLTGYTNYSVALFAGNSKRGTAEFRTLADPNGPNAISVQASDDLNTVIAGAAAGSILVLEPGSYIAGTVTLSKPVTIRGHYPYNKPQVNATFDWAGDAAPYDVEMSDLELVGTTYNTTFNLATVDVAYGSLILNDCYIHDYGRQLIYGNTASTVALFSLDNCIVSDFVAGGGDFIDFRPAYLAELKLTNSTFVNCAPARDFIRLDNSSATFPGLTTNVLIDHCTLYGVSDGNNRRVLYVRFTENVLNVKNTLIAETDGIYTNQALSSQPIGLDNNYFNAPGFHTPDYVANLKLDISGTFTTLDPGFVNAAGGDFTITNQTLIDEAIGDPRWRP